jgi:coenzyme F420-0:L-glutamate ligase/coenzyme F420-1:gamma-L-glutamate ligase
VSRFAAFGVEGVPEVRPGDDLAALLLQALTAMGEQLRDGDLVVVSSKVVSKAEDRFGEADSAGGRERAVDAQTERIVAERVSPRGVTRIVQSRSGPVLAAAGVDASNVPDGRVLLLPADPDASARALRAALEAATGRRLGVVVTDTLGRPWRHGQVDAAIGASGVVVGDDLAGVPDTSGRPLEVTHRALADEIAAAADLVKGKVDGVPAAVLRGLDHLVPAAGDPRGEAGAATLLRAPHEDWFRLGHVEAVRTSLGVPPGAAGVLPAPVVLGSVIERLDRAIATALASDQWPPLPGHTGQWVQPFVADETTIDSYLKASGALAADEGADQSPGIPGRVAMVVLALTVIDDTAAATDGDHHLVAASLVALGALAQRVVAAAWAQDLDVEVVPRPDAPSTEVVLRAQIR